MSNIMPNGTVLPSGLLGTHGPEAMMASFNRSYKNTGIKAGIVINTYISTNPKNQSKLCTEYDVTVMEQFENKGTIPITYKNCLSSQGFGSIADYFESTLRVKTFQTNKGYLTFGDQDGAIALIQCLDNIGDKAIVIGNLFHPDRPTNITSDEPQLFSEYNGVNAKVNPDGSCSLTFKGATDSKGAPIDSSQGNTVFQIKTDGSFEFNHSTIDILADKSGTLTINTKVDCKIEAKGNVSVACVDANIKTSGDTNVEASGKVNVKGTQVALNGQMMGQVLTTLTQPLADVILGLPSIGVPTVLAG